jgi:peptidoglycan/LPS O-acetylase OafA/YrhL
VPGRRSQRDGRLVVIDGLRLVAALMVVLFHYTFLLHGTAGYAIITRLHPYVPRWPLLVGLVTAMLVAASLVHRLVERPGARWLKRAMTTAIAAVDQPPSPSGYSRRGG